MKKLCYLILFINCIFLIHPDSIPQPKNDQLYTEFIARKKALFLKRPLVSSGYIVMNGKNKFLFKQTNPINIEVRRNNGDLTLKIHNNNPISINSGSNNDNIAFLFEEPEIVGKYYDITRTAENSRDNYLIIPRNKSKIDKIIVSGYGDIIQTIEIFFTDQSSISYEFSNTKTGIAPDEKLF